MKCFVAAREVGSQEGTSRETGALRARMNRRGIKILLVNSCSWCQTVCCLLGANLAACSQASHQAAAWLGA